MHEARLVLAGAMVAKTAAASVTLLFKSLEEEDKEAGLTDENHSRWKRPSAPTDNQSRRKRPNIDDDAHRRVASPQADRDQMAAESEFLRRGKLETEARLATFTASAVAKARKEPGKGQAEPPLHPNQNQPPPRRPDVPLLPVATPIATVASAEQLAEASIMLVGNLAHAVLAQRESQPKAFQEAVVMTTKQWNNMAASWNFAGPARGVNGGDPTSTCAAAALSATPLGSSVAAPLLSIFRTW